MKKEPTIHIAYAEDQTLIRKALISLLHLADDRFNVFIDAENGEDLLDKIAHARYQPDVCLIDIGMPVMNGYETVARIRKLYPHIRCLAITAYDEDISIIRMVRNGAKGYVIKNAQPEELVRAITEVYNGNDFFSGDVYKKVPDISRKGKDYNHRLFTEQEAEFLSWCCTDLTCAEIAKEMNLSPRTVENYCLRLRTELNISSRVGLAVYALRTGMGNFHSTPRTKSKREYIPN